MLAELAAYKEQTGGFAIAGMRKELAKWVTTQREQKLFKKPGTKTPWDRVDALGEIGFPWAPRAGTGPPKKKKQK